MEMFEACEAFSSLAQETRLKAFKALIEYGADGSPAGKLARELGIPDNTLSFHLSHMAKAGLVTSQKNGRSIVYYANTKLMDRLIDFLQENCCEKESKKTCKTNKSGRKC